MWLVLIQELRDQVTWLLGPFRDWEAARSYADWRRCHLKDEVSTVVRLEQGAISRPVPWPSRRT